MKNKVNCSIYIFILTSIIVLSCKDDNTPLDRQPPLMRDLTSYFESNGYTVNSIENGIEVDVTNMSNIAETESKLQSILLKHGLDQIDFSSNPPNARTQEERICYIWWYFHFKSDCTVDRLTCVWCEGEEIECVQESLGKLNAC